LCEFDGLLEGACHLAGPHIGEIKDVARVEVDHDETVRCHAFGQRCVDSLKAQEAGRQRHDAEGLRA